MCGATSNNHEQRQQRRNDGTLTYCSERRGSLIVLSLTILIIIIIVLTGICSAAILDKHESQIIILWLIGALVLVGLVSFVFLEIQRRIANKNRDMGANKWVEQTYMEQRQRGEEQGFADGPHHEHPRATWALTEPFRYSNSQSSTLKA